jgi:hypothetical protein
MNTTPLSKGTRQSWTGRWNWDEGAVIHARDTTSFYAVGRFRAGDSALHRIEAAELGDVRAKGVLHLQCY